jgi:hypothetical protein
MQNGRNGRIEWKGTTEPRSGVGSSLRHFHWPTYQIPSYMPMFVEQTISLAMHSYDLLGLLIPPFAQI